MNEMLYEQMGLKELDGACIDGTPIAIVWSDQTRAFSVGKKGKDHRTPNAQFLALTGAWAPYWLAGQFVYSSEAIEFALGFAANDTPTPYDEIDQEDE